MNPAPGAGSQGDTPSAKADDPMAVVTITTRAINVALYIVTFLPLRTFHDETDVVRA